MHDASLLLCTAVACLDALTALAGPPLSTSLKCISNTSLCISLCISFALHRRGLPRRAQRTRRWVTVLSRTSQVNLQAHLSNTPDVSLCVSLCASLCASLVHLLCISSAPPLLLLCSSWPRRAHRPRRSQFSFASSIASSPPCPRPRPPPHHFPLNTLSLPSHRPPAAPPQTTRPICAGPAGTAT